MQQYLETLFRRKVLFITPIIVIPLLAMLVTFYTGRNYTLRATGWVEQTQIVNRSTESSLIKPNVVESRRINDRLRTESFTAEVMERSGLTEAIAAGAWPQPTRLQQQLSRNPVLYLIGRALNLTPPATLEEAIRLGFKTVSSSVGASNRGDNLVTLSYVGPEPVLGQRLIEEILNLHQEEDLASRIRETESGMARLAREVQNQEEKQVLAVERLNRFEEQFPPPPAGLLRPVEEARELQRLQLDAQIAENRYLSALDNLEQLRLTSDRIITSSDLTFRVIDSPVASGAATATISPRRLALMGLMGGILASMFSIVAIVLITWRDKMIRTRGNVEKLIKTPSIIEIPVIPSSNNMNVLLLRSTIGTAPRGQ